MLQKPALKSASGQGVAKVVHQRSGVCRINLMAARTCYNRCKFCAVLCSYTITVTVTTYSLKRCNPPDQRTRITDSLRRSWNFSRFQCGTIEGNWGKACSQNVGSPQVSPVSVSEFRSWEHHSASFVCSSDARRDHSRNRLTN
jgi:hypothetical protein